MTLAMLLEVLFSSSKIKSFFVLSLLYYHFEFGYDCSPNCGLGD
jgi:hypothetical protein